MSPNGVPQRLPYLAHAFAPFRRTTEVQSPFALWGSRVAFFVLPQHPDADAEACDDPSSYVAPMIGHGHARFT